MKVTIEDRVYLIEFAYRKVNVQHMERDFGPVFEVREETLCLIRDGNAPRSPDTVQPVITQASVRCFHKDTPNREVARKRALAKVLEYLYPAGLSHDGKERRRLFWKAYLERATPQAKAANGGGAAA